MHPGTGTTTQRQNHLDFATAISRTYQKSPVVFYCGLIGNEKILREPVFSQMFMSYPNHYTLKFALRVFLQVVSSFTTAHNKSVRHVKRKLQFVPVYRYVLQLTLLHQTYFPKMVTDLKWFSFLFRRDDASGLL